MMKKSRNSIKSFDFIDVDQEIAKHVDGENFVIWSVSEMHEEDNNLFENILDQVAIEGKVKLVQSSEGFFGGSASKDYESKVLVNPTWLHVAICANEMIKTTGDFHHVYLEGVYKSRKRNRDGVVLYEFGMGS